MKANALYAQSGGVTSVINATACAVISTAKKYQEQINTVYAAKDGIIGALREELIDTFLESEENIKNLMYTPGGAFGSCRYKLKSLEQNQKEYTRLVEVFKAHNIKYFFYNGGGDSQDTAYKISQISTKLDYPITCIGIPKTVDNDLPFTDNCPGFASVAKYVATSIREASYDVASMSSSSTKVFILEVMGRHAGWIAASSGLAKEKLNQSPHIILFPEIQFDIEIFCNKVKETVNKFGYCTIVASEGIKDNTGKFLSESGLKDAFGHSQLGGVAPLLAKIVKDKLGYKYHWAVSDYLQRSARHIASETDLNQAYALGKAAVEFAMQGKNGVMPIIVRESDTPYKWSIGEIELNKVANVEKKMPRDFISDNGFEITEQCKTYLQPLIIGEAYPPYKNGLPRYITLNNNIIDKKLSEFNI